MQIHSNGSKWAGEEPDTLAKLLEVLKAEPLDPTFEEYGNFVIEDGDHINLFGNFYTVSHVFRIDGTRAELAETVAAIRANQNTEAYKKARIETNTAKRRMRKHHA